MLAATRVGVVCVCVCVGVVYRETFSNHPGKLRQVVALVGWH